LVNCKIIKEEEGNKMANYVVRLTIERIATASVEAKSEEEAKKKAFDWSNLDDELTESEEIIDVEVLGKEEE